MHACLIHVKVQNLSCTYTTVRNFGMKTMQINTHIILRYMSQANILFAILHIRCTSITCEMHLLEATQQNVNFISQRNIICHQ